MKRGAIRGLLFIVASVAIGTEIGNAGIDQVIVLQQPSAVCEIRDLHRHAALLDRRLAEYRD